ncbi:MAG: hypothetical protein HYU66_24880, partial [Armatimonadetes bacterium]|nr:hypothetical protein [Armatimonadota bacterium]
HGRAAQLDEKTARDPAWFLRHWRVLERPRAWTPPASPALDAAALDALQAELAARPLTAWTAPDGLAPYSLDFLAHHGGGENVAGYALCTIFADGERPVRLLAGSDDGIRVWLNGKLAIDDGGVKVVPVDGDKADVTLQAGENRILVECQQAGGGWQFSLRLTTPDGRPIVVGEDGTIR